MPLKNFIVQTSFEKVKQLEPTFIHRIFESNSSVYEKYRTMEKVYFLFLKN